MTWGSDRAIAHSGSLFLEVIISASGVSTVGSNAFLQLPRHEEHEGEGFLLLDVVHVVLERGNQVTPRLDSGNVLINSFAQYVLQMFKKVCVKRQGRPGHHTDFVLLHELASNLAEIRCVVVILS